MPEEPVKSPQPPAESNPTAANQTGVRSKPQSLLRMLGQLWGILLAFLPLLFNLLRQLWELILPLLKWLAKQWTLLLPKVRTILPASLSKLPDQAITAVAVSLLLLLFLLPGLLSSGSSDRIVATVPTTEQPNPTQPVRPQPDPNAKRIAAIQNQLAEVATPYAEDLVQAVQANFTRSRLSIQVASGWYSLDATQRDQLANALQKRSEKLRFKQLEITDAEGHTLARSPVVGSKMVLLTESA